jgi:hypothetical protein
MELQVQRIIAQSESEALQERMAKLDRLTAELGNLCTGAGFRSDQTTDVGLLDFGAI